MERITTLNPDADVGKWELSLLVGVETASLTTKRPKDWRLLIPHHPGLVFLDIFQRECLAWVTGHKLQGCSLQHCL